jgi:cytochrome c peroxidase
MRDGTSWCLVLGVAIALAALAPQDLEATPVDPEILRKVGPRVNAPGQNRNNLVEIGRRLFFEETFAGNGRTCGTCHPATNNFTIDPAFIRKLPRRDPLFVAEFNPKLKGLENAKLLRSAGLILENLDGFNRPGVLRGVPHNLALPTNMASQLPGKVQALGWSGDGSPGEGSLRLFAVGAVVQHFPKSLAREEGVDFRIPTDAELDALEAFMMSLGRRSDVDLAAMRFREEIVETGKLRFNGEGINRRCSACHANAGANNGDGVNANFDTGTRLLVPNGAPPDGGFGQDHQDGIAGFGNGTMNTPSLIEAADTPPFFHNNSARTLEDSIRFYGSDAFAASPAGQAGRFEFAGGDVEAIGALLRTLSAMENIRSSNVVAEQARRTLARPTADARIREALAETNDAIEVLTQGPIKIYPDAVATLRQAAQLEQQALRTGGRPQRSALLGRAIRLKQGIDMLCPSAGCDAATPVAASDG